MAIVRVDTWLFTLLDPGAFDPHATPPQPDYANRAQWAALPDVEDAADVFLPELPAVDPQSAPADVFYLHPTTGMGLDWNVATDAPAVVEATARGGTLIQASAFNACCAVYAPRYRQANGAAFTQPNADGDRALDVAYGDVARAFAAFQQRRGAERPFILASHSQGTVLAARLLREEIWNQQPEARLVAAYLIAGPIEPATLGGDVPVCTTATGTGCVVANNVRGPRYRVNELEFASLDAAGNRRKSLAGRICVTPLTRRRDAAHAPASLHQGAIFFDAERPALLPAFADAQCRDGALVVGQLGDAPRDFMSRVLDWMMGPENYHPIEYQLFYVNLRRNAVERVAASLAAQSSL